MVGGARHLMSKAVKRKNPFGGVAPIQLKVHVRAKHVASQEDMEEVYRRTREKLFQAGKGRLESNRHKEAVPCRCCKGQIMLPGITCTNCQFNLCGSSCLQECCICGKGFCHFCTVLNYDKPQVRTVCFNCVSSFS